MKKLVAINNFMLILTLFLSCYMYLYGYYLEELTYLKFLPNYDNANVASPQYNPDGSNKHYDPVDENTVLASDNINDYVPLYGLLLLYLEGLAFFTFPGLFISALILDISLIIKQGKNLGVGWCCFRILAYLIIVLSSRGAIRHMD